MFRLDKKAHRNFHILFGIVVVIVIADQWTKMAIIGSFRLGESLRIWSDYVALTYVRNQGAAFSLFNSAPAWIREPFFIALPLVAFGVIAVIFARQPNLPRPTVISLSLVCGGALGNLIDRIRFGYVIDFLHFHFREVYHWPMFNVADCCIVVGVSVMFVLSFKNGKRGSPALY